MNDGARHYLRERAGGAFSATALEGWAARTLVRPLQYFRRRLVLTLAVGVLAELALLGATAPGALDAPTGTPGAVGVAVAVLAAIAAGGVVGAFVALAGWWTLFLVVTEREVATLIALPVWVGIAFLVGLLCDALLQTHHELDRHEMDRVASHELRTPIATIAGLSGVLRARELPAGEARLVEVIEREAASLLALFDDWRADEFEAEEVPERMTQPTT